MDARFRSKRAVSDAGPIVVDVVRQETFEKGRALRIVVSLVVLALFALWYATAPNERDAIESLSSSDRHALYERTLKTVRTTCNPKTMLAGLASFCSEQAELLVKFPECDAACHELAKPHLAAPTR